MALLNKLFGEFVDIIEWLDNSNDTLVYRFERYGNEIKHRAKLTVREGQAAVFVHEGEIADTFGPGMYELTTANLPVLSTLQSWPFGFESPFKSEVYFFNTKRFPDLKWGTKTPVIIRDPEFGPVRLRAFGSYEIRITDPTLLLREIVGTDGYFTADEITNQLRNLIVTRFAAVLGSAGIPLLDLAANNDQLAGFISGRIAPEFANYGLSLTTLLVESISLPKTVEEALDKRSSMGMIGDLSNYAQYQAAEAMRAAAENPADGGAATGIGMGMGMAMANQMANTLSPKISPTPVPPLLPTDQPFHVAKNGQPTGPFTINQLIELINSGEVTGQSLVWQDGMASWEAARNIERLNGLFTSSPPPIPQG